MKQAPAIGRRHFLKIASAAAVSTGNGVWSLQGSIHKDDAYRLVAQTDHDRILKAASAYIVLKPETITAFPSDRSLGGAHDYFSGRLLLA